MRIPSITTCGAKQLKQLKQLKQHLETLTMQIEVRHVVCLARYFLILYRDEAHVHECPKYDGHAITSTISGSSSKQRAVEMGKVSRVRDNGLCGYTFSEG